MLSPFYQVPQNDDYEYDDEYIDDIYDYQNNAADESDEGNSGEFSIAFFDKLPKSTVYYEHFRLPIDTEEASEAEYNHDMNNDHRNHGEPLEIKEQ